MIKPKKEAKRLPRRVQVPIDLKDESRGLKWVGIGNSIKMNDGTIIPEATQKEYAWLFENDSCLTLIEKVNDKSKKPDTGDNK